ncbi:MAG: hypothetical protein IE916_10600 [Epsilonproteobacteria bacterium]|nr:hypothetical protein [Campylobacterota bacterium]MBD3830300.1 hypothetical protein [Arcobacter sp.]
MIDDIKNQRYIKLNLDNVFDRELLKHSYGFQSDAMDVILNKFKITRIFHQQLMLEKNITKDKASPHEKDSFRTLIKKDVRNALAYAKNEKDWKNILLNLGYQKVSIKSRKTSGDKREKTGLVLITKKGSEVYISFSEINLNFSKITSILIHNKKQNKFKQNYDSKVDTYQAKKENLKERLTKYEYKVKILLQIYSKTKSKELDQTIVKNLAKKYTVETSEMYQIITFKNKSTVIVDETNKITLKKANPKDINTSVTDMLNIAEMKGWDLKSLIISGSEVFIEEAKLQIKNRLQTTSKNINILGVGGLTM